MEVIELEDVQGYVIRGYKNMMHSKFVLLNVTDAAKAKAWIGSIAEGLTNAVAIPNPEDLPDTCLNIAFTAPGLKALGMTDKNVKTFSAEFREGMTAPHRQRLLGDYDNSAPDNWVWGGTKNDPVHIILLVFGKDEPTCLRYYNDLKAQYDGHGVTEQRILVGQTLPGAKEHFGFRDGIGQPIIAGSGRVGQDYNTVQPGEFILGYKNNYKVYPDSPILEDEQGNMNLLMPDPQGSGKKDLGRNGSFLVIRQMQEHVEVFWEFMKDKTKKADGSVDEEASIKLAAQMIGRWPSGAPLTKFPDKDPGGLSDDNDFLYHKDDGDGLKCPFGSHVRRMYPRDSFETDTAKESKILSNRHRLIRRARAYGQAIEGSPLHDKPKEEVGIYFSCFNADISRQFEFLNYTWSNYPKIKELYNDPDPIIGVRENPEPGTRQSFTIQGNPVNKEITDLKRFVTIRGGAYFFFPAINSVRYIASL